MRRHDTRATRAVRSAGCGLAWFLGTTAAVALLAATQAVAQAPAIAQAETRAFDIRAQSLAGALTAFGQQSGLQVTVDTAILAGLRSPGVAGSYPPSEALNRLLAGTGITWRLTDARTVALERVRAGGGAVTLDPVHVEAQRVPPTAMIGVRPPAYAGGQVARGGQLGLLGNRDVMEAPFNIASYTAQTIEDQQARSLGDVLANDPSVRANWPRGSYADNFMIRGFNLSNPNVALGGLYGLLPVDRVPIEAAERIEVLKGPSALLNGINPGGLIGGNINIVPKRADDEPLIRATASYFSDAEFGGHLDVGRRFGHDNAFGARLNGVYRNGDTAIDRQTEEAGIAVLGLDFRGESLRLSADLGYQNQRVEAPLRPVYVAANVPVPAAPAAGSNFFAPWTFVEQDDFFGVVRAEYDVLPAVTAFAAVGARAFRSDNLLADPTVSNAQGQFSAFAYNFPYDQDSISAETGVRARLETGPVGHQVSLIANTLRREFFNSFTGLGSFATNLYTPSYGVAPDLTGVSFARPKTSDSELSSLAVADTLSLFGERVLLTAGGRLQKVEANNFNPATGATTSSYDESAITPAVALVVKPWRNVSLYANYIEGLTQGPTAPNSAANRGEIFPPFESTQYEVGAKVDLGRLAATLSLFQLSQPSGLTDPGTLVFGVDGEQRNRGVELTAFGEVADGVRVLGGVTFMDGELTKTAGGTNDGKTAVGVPDVQLNLGAEWDPPFLRGLTVAPRVLYTSSQYLNAANTQRIPNWTRLDLGLRYRFETQGKPVIIRAAVENVFDESYWASTGGGYLTVGAPRTFLVSTTFDF